MAIKVIREQYKNADGSYDIIHPETQAAAVWLSDGRSVEEAIESGGESKLLRGPILITESQTVDLSTYGIKMGDTINVICVGGGAGGGGGYAGSGGDAGTLRGYGSGGDGGGGGESTSERGSGGGGGSGFVTKKSIILDTLQIPVTIGSGGTGGKGDRYGCSAGVNGGTTLFGSFLSASGGTAGGGGQSSGIGGKGGAGGNNGSDGRDNSGSIGADGAAGAGGQGFINLGPFEVGTGSDSGISSGSGAVFIWY